MDMKGFPTSSDIYLELDGKKVAVVQSYSVKATKSSQSVEAFGESCLLYTSGSAAASSFSAGEISVSTSSAADRSACAQALRDTAEELMAPYAQSGSFSFRSVRG